MPIHRNLKAEWYDSEAALVAAAANAAPCTVTLGVADYDFTGLEIPNNTSWLGVSGDASPADHTVGTRILGKPTQVNSGFASNLFRGIIFVDGFICKRQQTLFVNCAFAGELYFDGETGTPYGSMMLNCFFRDCTADGQCIRLRDHANGIFLSGGRVRPGQGARGIVGERGAIGVTPDALEFRQFTLEMDDGVTSLGSYIYGEFQNAVFRPQLDATHPATFTDGAMFKLTANALEVTVFASYGVVPETFDSDSGRVRFESASEFFWNGVDARPMTFTPGIPTMFLHGPNVATSTLQPAAWAGNKPMIVTAERDPSCTISPQPGETITGDGVVGGNLVIEQNEVYLLFTKLSTSAWQSRQITGAASFVPDPVPGDALTTEGGDPIVTEGGDYVVTV